MKSVINPETAAKTNWDITNMPIESFNLTKGNHSAFMEEYVNSWQNYGSEVFSIKLENNLEKNTDVNFDRSIMTVMLEAILDNVSRHGFQKRKSDANGRIVSFDLVTESKSAYRVISISNNGRPMADGFTIDNYISRSRYSATSGRSGLGGFHAYQVAKGHGEFISISSNNRRSVIIDVLISALMLVLKIFPHIQRHVGWFSKSIVAGFYKMFDAIRSEVEIIQSPEFIITNRYCNELKATAFLGKDCEAKILNPLIQDYENSLAENDDSFNSLRKILERIFQVLKRYAIIPPYKRINEIASYLFFNNLSKKSEYFGNFVTLKKTILPKVLASEVYSMPKLLQNGNHDAGYDLADCANGDADKCSEGALEYEVEKYWRNTKDTSFFNAMLWIIVGLIHCTYDICMKHPNAEENKEQIWCECSFH